LGFLAGVICTAAYLRWRDKPWVLFATTGLGAILGLILCLMFIPFGFVPSSALLMFGGIIGLVGGRLLPQFAEPTRLESVTTRRKIVAWLALLVVLSQCTSWALWARGPVIVSATNGAKVDALTGEVRKIPPNRNPLDLYFPRSEQFWYQVDVYRSSASDVPIFTSREASGSVEIDDTKIKLIWIEPQKLHVDIDQRVPFEVSPNDEGIWRAMSVGEH
jgi:hypothetical protein